METHSPLSSPVRAIVALVALAFCACSSNGAGEGSGDGSERNLDGAQAGSAASAGAGGAAQAAAGAPQQPDGQGTGDTGSLGVDEPDRDPDAGEGQGGGPSEGEGAAGAGGETAGMYEPPAPSEAFLRGEALVTENQCVTCHQRNFAGFTVFPNITPDEETGIGGWSDAQIVAAVREGVDADGARLCVTMQRYPFSDEQASDVVAFLRGLSPVSNRVTSVCPGHEE